MKKIYKCVLGIFFLLVLFFNINIIKATSDDSNSFGEYMKEAIEKTEKELESRTVLDGILKSGSSWFSEAEKGGVGDYDLGKIISDMLGTKGSGGFIDAIFQLGNLVFICVTIALGIKYSFSSIEGKADVKEGLIPLSIGAVFFYLAQTVYNFSKNILDVFAGINSINSVINEVFSTVSVVANTCAIIAIVIMGLKYMLTSADERAQLKQRMVPLVIGLALIYASTQILGLIVSIADSII